MMPTVSELTPGEIFVRNTAYLLRKRRLFLCLLIIEAAERAKLCRKVLAAAETGSCLSTIDTYHSLADAYGMDYSFLSATYTTVPSHQQLRELDIMQAQLEAYKKSHGKIKMNIGTQLELPF